MSHDGVMEQTSIRPVHDHEWREVRELRLRALQDEAAPIAFIDTFDAASVRPEEFWQQRAASSSVEAGSTADARQFIAITEEGRWVGSLTVLVERPGEKDFEGKVIQRAAAAIVGVYLEAPFRGRGLIQAMFDQALDWARERGLEYARLYVHAENQRAQGAYERAGFRPTGATFPGALGEERELAREI